MDLTKSEEPLGNMYRVNTELSRDSPAVSTRRDPCCGFFHIKQQTWMAHPMFSDRRERSGWMSLFT